MALRLILLTALVAGSLAGPISSSTNQDQEDLSQCLKEQCPVTDHPTQGFKPQRTYIYSYEGTSLVQLHRVPLNASSSLQVKADVHLSWVSPCQMVVAIKRPTINGHSADRITTEQLTAHPMVVTMKEGVVTLVCAHPEDHPTGLNLKKGIMSTMQNVLPSFSSVVRDKTYYETDVLGRCPTQYDVKSESSGHLVKKFKDHKQCLQQHHWEKEAPVTAWWLQTPMPLKYSNSSCHQIWTQEKVVKKVSCTDRKILKPILGTEKQVEAVQWSTLTLKNVESSLTVRPFEQGRLTNLTFEVINEPKTEEIVQKVEELLKDLCSKIQRDIQEDAAPLVAKLIGLLHRVPENKIKQILEEIKSGRYCQNSKVMESLYKDAIMFVNNGGAVEVMVDEVLSRRVSGGRTPMYTIAIHTMKKPCVHAVKAVSRLFDSREAPSSMVMAAGTLVSKYCRSHPKCLSEPAIREIQEKLSRRLDSTCSSSKDNKQNKIQVLTALKAIGNMANITKPLERSIMKCVESSSADIMVRVAAAQSFRQAACHEQPTEQLVKVTTESSCQTEVRIASYVSAMRCVSYEQAKHIVDKISMEPNTQVRAFILSHMRNVQDSNDPSLRGIRYNISSLIVPTDYAPQSFKPYSRHIDLSYFLPTQGLGESLQTSVIYAPGSYIPRQFQTNFSLNIFDNIINIGEFAVRVEDIENLLENVFGPEGYLYKKPIHKIVQDFSEFVNKNSNQIKEHFAKNMKNRNQDSMDWSSIHKQIGELFRQRDEDDSYTPNEEQRESSQQSRRRGQWQENSEESSSSQQPKIDAFLRLFGQEVAFTSIMGDLSRVNSEELLEKLVEIATKVLMKVSEFNVQTARVLQANSENFIATQQGVPLQVKLVTTVVAGVKAVGGFALEKSNAKLRSQISAEVNGFVGYTLAAKAGLRTRAKIHTHAPLEFEVEKSQERILLKVDMPEERSSMKVQMDTHSIFKMPSKRDEILKPSKGSHQNMSKKECADSLSQSLGIKLCYDFEIPNLQKENIFPLGSSKLILTAAKAQQRELIRITGSSRGEPSRRSVALQIDAPCAQQPRKGEIEVEYKNQPELKSVKVYVQAARMRRSVKVDFEPKSSRYGRKYEMIIYSGEQKEISSADKVLVAAIGGGASSEEMSAQLEFKTMNALKEFLKANIEIETQVEMQQRKRFIPSRIELRKFEVDVEIPECFSTRNYIRQESANSRSLQYRLQSVTRTQSSELLSITGETQVEGSLKREDLDSHTVLEVKTPRQNYKYEAKMAYNDRKVQAMAKIQSESSQRTVLLVNVLGEKSSPSSPEWTTKAEIAMPRMMPSYRIDGAVQEKSSNSYRVRLTAKRENQPMYQIEGPVTLILSEDSLKQQSELILKDLQRSKEFQVKSKLQIAPGIKIVLLDMKQSGKQVLSIEGEMSHKALVELSSSLGLHIPEIVEGKLKVDKSSSNVQMMVNGYLRPNTPESQRIKASAAIDLEQKDIKAKAAYNSERESENEIEIDARYDLDRERKYAAIKGDVSVSRERYSYSAEALLGALNFRQNDRNEVKIKIAKPNGSVYLLLETSCAVQDEGSYKKSVEYQGKVQIPTFRKPYAAEGRLAYDLQEAPSKMSVNGKAQISTPRIDNIAVILESEVDVMSSSEQKLIFKMDVAGSGAKRPLKTELEIRNSFSGVHSNLNLHVTPINMAIQGKVHAKRNERQDIHDIDAQMAFHMPNGKKYELKTQRKSDKNLEMSLISEGRKVAAWEHENNGQGNWKARMTAPSRVVEAHSKNSQEGLSLAVYPDKERSDDKYEVSSHYRRNRESALDAGASISYPGREEPYAVRTNMDSDENSSQGTLELNVFDDPNQKILIQVQTMKLDKGSYKAVAQLHTSSRSSNPKIIVEAGLSPKVKLFKIAVEDGSQQMIKGELSYNQPADNHAYIFAHLKTREEKVEMIAALQGHTIYQCRGGSINGTIKFNDEKSYDFASAVCAPGYIEVGVKESSERKMCIAKLGMKNPSELKLALDMVHNSTKAINVRSVKKLENTLNLYGKHTYLPKETAILLGAELWAPMMVSVDAQYDVEKVEECLEKVVKPISYEIKRGIERMSEAGLSSMGSSYSHFKKMNDDMGESISNAMQEYGLDLPSIDELKEMMMNCFQKGLRKFQRISSQVEEMLQQTLGLSFRDINQCLKDVDRQLKEMIKPVIEEIRDISQEGRDALMRNRFCRWIVSNIEDSSIFNWITEIIRKFVRIFEVDLQRIREFVCRYFEQLKQDLKQFLDTVADLGICRKFIKWIESWLFDNSEMDTPIIAALVKKLFSFYMDQKVAFARMQIPLRRPVASLTAAVPSVGIPLPMCMTERYGSQYNRDSDNYILSALTSPHSATAKLTQGQITTFDGMTIPFIKSECQIKMAAAQGVEVCIKQSADKRAEVLVKSDKGQTVTLQMVEGQQPLVEGSKLAQSGLKKAGIDVQRNSESEVKAETKCLRIIVNQEEVRVEAKPSAYNQVEGLMGTHDNEMSTDIQQGSEVDYKPDSDSGSHQLSFKDARKLFDSNKKDSSCKIPMRSRNI